ncbi:MAG: fused MFS/spermidine synthase [Leptospiraceae bacterium]|nr:fused MFS/spermidine synthase [Leptospiraceae bacterium]
MFKKPFIVFYLMLSSFTILCSENESKTKPVETKKEKFSVSEELVYEVKSKYSHIKVADYGTLRQLYFVRDNGEEALESTIDTNYPQNLFLLYTQTMFASFLINKDHKDILLVGLGGGGMVHFLNYYFPKVKMDAVEIDPEIVSIAKKFFKLKDHPSTNIFTDDATNFIYTTQKTYDVIYMDAFLKPTQETDSTGVAQKLKAPSFLQKLKTKLNKNGIVVFNINNHEKMQNDIKTIRQEFSNIYFFQKNRSGNLIVIGSTDTEKISIDKMLLAAKDLDKKNKVNFSFSDIAKYYKENFE